MDEYISEFLYSNYNAENSARKLLAWLLIDKKNTANKINGRLTHAIENQKILDNKKYIRWVDNYKKFYETHQAPQINAIRSANKIKILQVSDFRGFGKLSDEDRGVKIHFNKLNNIFFAPNGGGKSSLCEALEYQTTGDIKEAGRRKTSIKNYIRRNGKHTISLLDHSNNEMQVNTDYKFNFIDRNRLQEFSLLGSSDTKFGERDVLAALVGLETFDSFLNSLVGIKSFNAQSFKKSIHEQKLDTLRETLTRYRKASDENQEELKNLKLDILDKIGCDYKNLSERYLDNVVRIKIPFFKKHLIKLNGKKEQLKQGKPSVEISNKESNRIVSVLLNLIKRKQKVDHKLTLIAYNDDLINLYTLSKKILERTDHAECPLCKTPIDHVTTNPLENSIEILKSYIHITTLQKCRSETEIKITKFKDILAGNIRSFLISPINTIIKFDYNQITELLDNLINSHDEGVKNALTCLNKYINACVNIEQYNEKSRQHNATIKDVDNYLIVLNKKIEHISLITSKIDDNLAIYRSKIQNKENKKNAFDKVLKEINRGKELCKSECEKNVFLQELFDEYTTFYNAAYLYKRTKEAEILAGIEDSIVHYYNEINKHDDDSEKLEQISFVFDESLKSYRIQLDINGEHADAFVRLSEGHLKSLGLSVLLALAKKKRSQFIVFDDVVNAIDTEHRSNIINTFLTDPYIKQTQKIITTHDKLFWELYSNREKHLGNGEFASFILNCYSHGIHYEERDISFEGKISDSLEHYDVRQALIYCRIWFESLAAQHCVESGLSLTASFSQRDYQKPNFIKISLEKMYAVLIESLGANLENINEIKTNFLSWGVQNQEHHAFSENNYNIVHSKTSQEIQIIFDAIRKFKIQLSPEDSLVSLNEKLTNLDEKINKSTLKIDKATQLTPADILRQWRNDKAKFEREKTKTLELKVYCETFLL